MKIVIMSIVKECTIKNYFNTLMNNCEYSLHIRDHRDYCLKKMRYFFFFFLPSNTTQMMRVQIQTLFKMFKLLITKVILLKFDIKKLQ